MSNIFDALQRSQAKQTGSNAPLSMTAIDLLERAERAATAQSKADNKAESPLAPDQDHANVLFGPDGFGHAPLRDAAGIVQALRAEERRESLGQMQALEMSLPDDSLLVCISNVSSPAAEAYRLLAVRLRHLRVKRELRRLLITSTVPQEGKSVSAANLACALASGGQQRVLLLDGDVRRPTLAQLFGLPHVPGLCNCLQRERSLIACIYRLEQPGLWILPAGGESAGLAEVIQLPELPSLLDRLDDWFDWIIIDSPPVLPLADTSVWARLADGILLVARPGTTEKTKLERGLESLDQNKLIGAIMNSSTASVSSDYYYRPTTPETPENSHS